ncbi:MAG: flagellar motor protein MotB [Rickettsiales bacterium]
MSFYGKKKHEEAEENWLISYADMITLLLCFFVILLSVSEPKKEQLEAVSEAMKQAINDAKKEEKKQDPMEDLKQDLETMIVDDALEEAMSVAETEKGIVIDLSTAAFYESGSATIRKDAEPYLQRMTEILKKFDLDEHLINVIGHTDDAPIHTAEFPSNWELSAVRATRIVRFFADNGIDHHILRSSGFADTEPKWRNLDDLGNPIEENRERNRRITIKIEALPED